MSSVSHAIVMPAFFQDAETSLSSVSPFDTWAFCATLHALCAEVTLTEAFNVAFWSEQDQTLHFPYNYDEGFVDVPITLPLGDGPTSWVIRETKPFIQNPGNTLIATGSVCWGQSGKKSASSIHLPMRAGIEEGKPTIVGVMSTHAYSEIENTPDTVVVLQWLADRAGAAWQCRRDLAKYHRSLREIQAELKQTRESRIALCNAIGKTLFELSQRAEIFAKTLEASEHPLSKSASGLCRALYSAQAEVTMHPVDGYSANEVEGASRSLPECFTFSEKGVVQGIMEGRSNSEIAEQLHISVSTVKFHLHNIYQKLGTTSRSKVAHLLRSRHGSSRDDSHSNGQ